MVLRTRGAAHERGQQRSLYGSVAIHPDRRWEQPTRYGELATTAVSTILVDVQMALTARRLVRESEKAGSMADAIVTLLLNIGLRVVVLVTLTGNASSFTLALAGSRMRLAARSNSG